MISRPIHITAPSELDIGDRNFPKKYLAWTDQIRSEMEELSVLTKRSIGESRALMTQIDQLLARR